MITAVVVPIHDEAELLPACLDALAVVHADVVVLVADACSDHSTAIAKTWCRGRNAWTVTTNARNVGAARAHGVAAAIMRAGTSPDALWLATTDADSRVPANWLTDQLEANVDAYAGSIDIEGDLAERFRRFYASQTHVHGTSLGVRADAYLEVGGFAPLATGEDHALWNALAGHRRVFSRNAPVITSTRRKGRAPSGFAGFLEAFGAA